MNSIVDGSSDPLFGNPESSLGAGKAPRRKVGVAAAVIGVVAFVATLLGIVASSASVNNDCDNLVFRDDFNGESLNDEHWFAYQGGPWRASNTRVYDGHLILKASKGDGVVRTGGIQSRHGQRYGFYRMKIVADESDLATPSALTWPKAGSGTDSYNQLYKPSALPNSQARWHTIEMTWTAEKVVVDSWTDGGGHTRRELPSPKTEHGLAVQLNLADVNSSDATMRMMVDYVEVYSCSSESPASTTDQPTTTETPTTETPTTETSTTQAPITTAPATSVPVTTAPATTAPITVTTMDHGNTDSNLEPMRNDQQKFKNFENVPSDQLNFYDSRLTTEVSPYDNGTVADNFGQFRVACQYSHFGYDDPIVKPNRPGESHLHMFFGNTKTNAFTNQDSLVNEGGGTCSGFELNRSGYWTPALMDGRGNAIVPDNIVVYYKSKHASQAKDLPQGLKIVAGATGTSFTANHFLHWSCGGSGHAYNHTNRIPNCNGDVINATVAFPNCWNGQDLDSADHRSHMAYGTDRDGCPSSHPVVLPQITILLYFPGASSVAGWHLSSDGDIPGGGLHADWFGGWQNETTSIWTRGCITRARNCSNGQTGTNRLLHKVSNLNNYEGNNFIPIPQN